MSKKVYVLIGRFQILHKMHVNLIDNALKKADQLIILVGSADLAPDPKNPFTFEERKSVLKQITQNSDKAVTILPLHDYIYNNNKWLRDVNALVNEHAISTDITISGCQKDDSTYYLEFFKHWKQDFLPVAEKISATDYRIQLYEQKTIHEELPQVSKAFLTSFLETTKYQYIVDWHEYNKVYQKRFSCLPYAVPFNTGDAIVTCCGHILLVKRKAIPGKGLWAMPGGFFNSGYEFNSEGLLVQAKTCDVTMTDAAIRELQEETGIDVPEKVLRGNIKKEEIFADPNRSLRWRIITNAIHIQLPDTKLPKVKGMDDAEKAFWLPISELKANRHKFFEDHLCIIDSFLGIL